MFTGIIFYKTFVISATLMSLTPGIDTAVATRMVVAGGKGAGIAAAFGIALGVVLQSTLAGLGLVAIFRAFPYVFNIVKYIGAAYLFYPGVRALYDSVRRIQADDSLPFVKKTQAFIQGFLGDALNPKITIFIVTFYPPFIDEIHKQNLMPYEILGLTYALIALVWYIVYAFIATKLLGRLGRKFGIVMTRISGVVLISMGLLSAFS